MHHSNQKRRIPKPRCCHAVWVGTIALRMVRHPLGIFGKGTMTVDQDEPWVPLWWNLLSALIVFKGFKQFQSGRLDAIGWKRDNRLFLAKMLQYVMMGCHKLELALRTGRQGSCSTHTARPHCWPPCWLQLPVGRPYKILRRWLQGQRLPTWWCRLHLHQHAMFDLVGPVGKLVLTIRPDDAHWFACVKWLHGVSQIPTCQIAKACPKKKEGEYLKCKMRAWIKD